MNEMNCQAVQNLILHLPDPRELSPELRGHVLGCAACSEWAKQAARLESLLTQLPVPPAPGEKKEAMLEELTANGPVITRIPTVRPDRTGDWFDAAGRFLRRNATYVGGLAAAVLVAVGIYVFWPRSPVPQPVDLTQEHPLLKKMVARDIELSRAKKPEDRVAILNVMADDLATETRGMARIASGDELRQMVVWYNKVVNEGLVKQAKEMHDSVAVNPTDKKKILEDLVKKLKADENEAKRVMAESPQEAQPALKRMADTAHEGQKTLLALTG